MPRQSSSEKASLIKLLRGNQFTDRYYAEAGEQPAGASGIPEEISKHIREEKQAERKQRQDQRRMKEMHALQAKQNDDLNARTLRHMEMQAEKELALAERRAKAEREQEHQRLEVHRKGREALLATEREAQRLGAKQSLKYELEKQSEMQKSQREHLALVHTQERRHTEAQDQQRVRTLQRAADVETKAQQKRLDQEAAHRTAAL